MNTQFLELLREPESKEALIFETGTGTLSTANGVSYKLIEKVPVLLPQHNGQQPDYQTHYENDALAFDYFSDWDPITQEENRRLHQQILRQIPADASWILDVGCGGAWLAGSLCPKGRQVISMDISTANPVRALKEVTAPT